MSEHIPIPDPGSIRRALLDYFDAVADSRELPWRDDDHDPYRVWVSEVMLQQTRAESVVPYYHRWLRRFPDLNALADADEDDVLKQWEGLGYYRRARHLHQAARVVCERHHGRLPADPAELKELPGIGEYTAGAVASIAYGIPAPAVDGNTRRVLCRLYDRGDPSPSELRNLATPLVPADRPGDFNQALMELGATVCTPRSPACDACPVADQCLARSRGTQEERPRGRQAKRIPHFDFGTAVLVRPDGSFLLTRRPAHGLLAGLWEFPASEVGEGEDPIVAASRAAAGAECRDSRPSHDARFGDPDPLGAISHAFSHRRHTYHAYLFRALGNKAAGRRRAGPWTAGRGTAGRGPLNTGETRTGADTGETRTGADTGQARTGADTGEARTGAGPAPLETAWIKRGDLTEYAIPSAQRRILDLWSPP